MHRLRFVLLVSLFAACHVPSARHPLRGRSHPVRAEHAYWIFADDGWLHVRVTSGDHVHRFQGSVTAVRTGLGALELDRPALADRVAKADSKDGDSVQFDLEPPRNTDEGFRVHIGGACVRFDLYLDGQRRPEHVHLGARHVSPKQVPFERCP